jgi:hypothetical protein
MNPRNQISQIATSCWEFFNECLSKNPDDDTVTTLEREHRRFLAWTNSLKVFARTSVSLDTQLLPDANEQIRKIVLLLLEVLQENLSLGTLVSVPDAWPGMGSM